MTLLKVSPPGFFGLATPAHLVSVLTIGLEGYSPSVNVTIARPDEDSVRRDQRSEVSSRFGTGAVGGAYVW
jgi:hypothetical protein